MKPRVPPLRALQRWVCPSCQHQLQRTPILGQRAQRSLHTETPAATTLPFRKQLKDEAKRKRLGGNPSTGSSPDDAKLARWELTVGIEIHAQLNTERKLFSSARAAVSDEPNVQVALFDVSIPGSQPLFQPASLLPAIRAALALNCQVQRSSSFDRKHYFYPDQPAGYQITQYYAPLARDGHIRLDRHDGIASNDGDGVTVGIKQIQLEQDTAKTIQQPPDVALLDFNRVGHPLIEIITLPHIHHPATAAACVRKIQQTLLAVSAVTTGMELGGLRADVNVSVRPRGTLGAHAYAGVTGLGTRTEIKNLNSFKAIEDAIVAERNRQIEVLEAGGTVAGETRGWTLGSTATRKLRGKEGEVDYRYMPDPDLAPVLVGAGLVEALRDSLPMLPDDTTGLLTTEYGLSLKDAKTLVALDDGTRLDYFRAVLDALEARGGAQGRAAAGPMAGNWVLHELGGLLTRSEIAFAAADVPPASLAAILHHLHDGAISGRTAKQLLATVFDGADKDVDALIDRDDLRIRHLSDDAYRALAQAVIDDFPHMAEKVRAGQTGKRQWLLGQMIRRSDGRVDATRAARELAGLLQPRGD